jgi:hypothetical protein
MWYYENGSRGEAPIHELVCKALFCRGGVSGYFVTPHFALFYFDLYFFFSHFTLKLYYLPP